MTTRQGNQPTPLTLVDALETGRHRDAVSDALEQFDPAVGRPASRGEAEAIEMKIRERAIDAIVATVDGRPDWRADTLNDLDGGTFGLGLTDALPTIWGAGERAYWTEGELAILYGGDGTSKTTLTHNILAGMLGFDGHETVLGEPVRPLAGDERILYLAFDRPRQIERSWSRFMRTEYVDRVRARVVWRTDALPFDASRHPTMLTDWVAETYPETYAVIFDNVWDAFGDFSRTEHATSAGIALNGLARSGYNVLALHHDRKQSSQSSKQTRPPETDDGMYGGRNFKAKTGSVVNLWKPPGSDGSLITVTQHKEPSEKIPPTTVFVNQIAGSLVSLTSGRVSVSDYLKGNRGRWTEMGELARIHRATERPDNADREATRRELRRLVEAGVIVERESEGRGHPAAWKWKK